MSLETSFPLMTAEEFLALPESDTVKRYLIRGRLREVPRTKHNRYHSRLEARIAHLLGNWLDSLPEPRGELHAGEAGCILRREPDTTVGIDVLYLPHDVAARQSTVETTMIEGIPVLAVEILSPANTMEEINEKLEEYLAVKVPLIWLVDPHLQIVQVLRPGHAPETFTVTQELSGEPHLPGFRVPVARIFSR